jgi:hypothetical protein
MARDIERIERIMYKIGKLWVMFPDQRFFQLLYNYTPLGYYVHEKKDPFHYEDEGLEAYLDGVLDSLMKPETKTRKKVKK